MLNIYTYIFIYILQLYSYNNKYIQKYIFATLLLAEGNVITYLIKIQHIIPLSSNKSICSAVRENFKNIPKACYIFSTFIDLAGLDHCGIQFKEHDLDACMVL